MSVKASKRSFTIAGLHVHVYYHPDVDIKSDYDSMNRPVSILFFLHGRMGSASEMEGAIENIVMLSHSPTRAKDLFVVSFDQRNHGTRLVNIHANLAWKEKPGVGNERHAVDMYAIQTGTARDVSFIIDFLPSFLFPSGERTIADWSVSGFSLGGHASWIALAHEPRLSAGIIICGCPDYLPLITERAEKSSVPASPPYIPDSLRTLVRRDDPASQPYRTANETNPFFNKKLLIIAAGKDIVVTWAACETFIRELAVGPDGVKKVLVEEDAPHSCSETMVKWASEFVQEHILAAGTLSQDTAKM